MKYIIGNWKTNKDVKSVKEWAKSSGPALTKVAGGGNLQSKNIQVVLCPSFVHLSLVKELLPELCLGVQTVSPYPNGQYTGAVSAQIVREFAEYAILGHTERRKFFHETILEVANQAIQTLESKMTPIIAVDKSNWSDQLSQLDDGQLAKTLVMYEPPESISTGGQGHPADLHDVKETIQLIKSSYNVKGVLYGGSVNSENVAMYIGEEIIDGVVPGAASLDAQEFVRVIANSLKTI